MNVDDIVPADVRHQHGAMREHFMQNRQHRSMGGVHGEFRAVTRTGREFPVELGLTRLPPVDEHGLCACATLRDISQRKANEKTILDQLEFQRVLLDTLPYPVFFKDQQGRYLGFNQAYLQAFAVSGEALIGKTVADLSQLPASEIHLFQQANRQVLNEGGSFKAETNLQYADGQWHPSLYMLSAFKDSTGSIAGTVGTLIDISAQKSAELAHQQARQLAEDATRLKSDFLANMSHEIRTPMNIILGMAHLALEQQPERRQRNYLEKIQTSAQNLLGIINDILDFSKIEAGKMHLEHIDFYLEDILQRLADQAVFRAQEKGLELLFDLNPQVPSALIGDPLRLSQILHNLLSNAIKFTEHGEITLRIRVEQQNDQQVWLQFEVNDTGIGMSPEQQQRLFQAFSQADSSTSRKYGGTGLGLNICKQLTELLGGSIGLDSEIGVGSTFYFRLPFALQQQQRQLTSDATLVHGMTVLVVDDNPTARDIIQSMLTSLKFHADTAANGAEALEKIQSAHHQGSPYQLVMMDWKMPGMDGLETIRQIKQQAGPDAPFFVMVTAYNRDELLAQAAELSIQAVLVKPLTPSTLLDSILMAFGQQVLHSPRRLSSEQAYRQAIAAIQGAHLLLVEDNPVNQEMAAEILQNAGIRVDIANNGAEAISMVNRLSYDGVLMDCQMPVMDGFEAARRIRLLQPDGKLPILAMTANAMVGDKEKCLAAGMNDHIAKPIEVEKLFLTLQKWITPARPLATLASSQQPTPVIGCIAGLSVDAALHRLGNNQALFHKLLLRFCQTQQDLVPQLNGYLENCQQDDAVRLVHTFKGLAGNIGAKALSQLATELEAALRFADSGQVQVLQQQLGPLLAAQITAIQQVLTQLETQQKFSADASACQAETGTATHEASLPDLDHLLALLQQLQQLLTDADGSAADFLQPHVEALAQVLPRSQLTSVQRLLSQFDYDAALPYVKVLQQQLVSSQGRKD
jgi:PAS domain S-box-containing protein